MNNLKSKWIIAASALLVILLAVSAGWLYQSYLQTQAEIKWQEMLKQAGLQDKAQWSGFSASLRDVITLDDLRIGLANNIYLDIKQLRISDRLDQPDRQRIRLQLKQAKPDFSEVPLDGYQTYALINAFPHPFNLDLQVDLNFANNQAHIIYDGELEGYADVKLELNLSQIEALRPLLASLYPQSAAVPVDFAAKAIDLNVLADISALELNHLSATVKNRGLVAQAMAIIKMPIMMEMMQRSNPAATPKQVDEAVLTKVQEMQADCYKDIEALKSSCEQLADFFLEKKPSLQITVNPTKGLSFQQMFQQIKLRKDKDTIVSLLQLLNVNIR